MRAYTLTASYLFVCCVAACTEQTDLTDAGTRPHHDAAVSQDAGDLDAGPMQCETQGVWQITFDMSEDNCLRRMGSFMYELNVGHDDLDVETSDAGAEKECGPRRHKLMVSSDGCSVTASSLSTSCSNGEPQCQEYKLDLQVHGDTADVTGTYRRCWCGAQWMGSAIPITGKAVRK